MPLETTIEVWSEIVRSARVAQIEGMFDVAPSELSKLRWKVALPLEDRKWNLGLIVGPSGCGKSTIARKLWPDETTHEFAWHENQAVVDAFPSAMGIKDVVELLSSVGFSSPPSWLRPFRVLSNGEQFRVTLARLLAELPSLAVMDEYTSVIDRTVAQLGSAALAKAVRRRDQAFVAVTCHSDVEDWLQPDWVYRPDLQLFTWRKLRRRPPIELTIRRVPASTWRCFSAHHYLSGSINRTAVCFVASWNERPVAFDAWLPFVGRLKDRRRAYRAHRSVCLPDYQGIGIGNALSAFIASLWRGLGYRAFFSSSHPGAVNSRLRSPLWKLTSAPNRHSAGRHAVDRTRARNRLTTSFEYVGASLDRDRARRLLRDAT